MPCRISLHTLGHMDRYDTPSRSLLSMMAFHGPVRMRVSALTGVASGPGSSRRGVADSANGGFGDGRGVCGVGAWGPNDGSESSPRSRHALGALFAPSDCAVRTLAASPLPPPPLPRLRPPCPAPPAPLSAMGTLNGHCDDLCCVVCVQPMCPNWHSCLKTQSAPREHPCWRQL